MLREIIIQAEDNYLMKILSQIKRLDSFINTHITYIIMLIVRVTVALTKEVF